MTTIPVNSGGTLKAGETFEFSGASSDCQVSHCQPPLTEAAYHVPASGTTQATVSANAAPGDYVYTVTPSVLDGNPKIHISS